MPLCLPKGESKPDFAITSQIAKDMGIILEGVVRFGRLRYSGEFARMRLPI